MNKYLINLHPPYIQNYSKYNNHQCSHLNCCQIIDHKVMSKQVYLHKHQHKLYQYHNQIHIYKNYNKLNYHIDKKQDIMSNFHHLFSRHYLHNQNKIQNLSNYNIKGMVYIQYHFYKQLKYKKNNIKNYYKHIKVDKLHNILMYHF